MPCFWTKDEILHTFKFKKVSYTVTIPKHTAVRWGRWEIGQSSITGQFWVKDLSWINREAEPFVYHEADYRGIVIDPELVEEV